MSKKIFTTKEKVIGIIVLLLLGFSFYWYSLRPYLGEQKCLNKAEQFSRSSGQSFEDIYNHCLLTSGLK